MQYAIEFDFACQYWELLLNKRWRELQQKCDTAKFRHTNGTSKIPSNFEFLVQANSYFPTTDGICYKTTEVYSQSLKDIIKDWKPIAYFELTSSQENLLGIKSELSVDECFEILELIAKSPIDKERISALYKYILNHFDAEAIKEALVSTVDFQLLAINNSFQPISNLQYLNLPKFVVKADLANFIFLGLDKDEAIKFCKLFEIKVIDEKDLELQASPSTKNEDSFKTKWDLKVPYIAVISSAKKGINYLTELTQLNEKTKETVFKSSEKLTLVLNNGEETIYEKEVSTWQQNNDIYYAYNWQDKRVIFEFSEVLCRYFDIKETERELELILTLKQDEVYDWLEEQGFNVSVIQKEQKRVQIEPNISEEFEIVSEPPIFRGTAYGVGRITTSKSQSDTRPDMDTQFAKEIGRSGEKRIQKENTIENHYKQNNIEIVSINWLNEKNESREPYDFEVETIDGIKHYWEVKSTPSTIKAEFPISSNEIQFALENSEVYFIVRVFNAGDEKDQTEHKILSNPIELIKNGRIKISDVKMVIVD